jgi:hypothetical protein
VAVAARTETADLADQFIQRVRSEPCWFARDVLNHKAFPGEPTIAEDAERSWELDQCQIDLIEATMDVWRKKQGIPTRINHDGAPYITVRSGHGSGKTHTAALIAMLFGAAFPARIICTAPKLQQLRTRLWGSLRKIDARAEGWWRSTHVIHDTAIYWKRADDRGRLVEDRNWCVLAETATHPENLAGHHERFQLIIADEATGISETLWPVVFGALSSGELQVLLMISNPTRITGAFANSHLQKREEANYFRYHIKLDNARRINRSWVSSMERKYGKDSPVVAVRCHGEFPTSNPNQLIALEWVQRAMEQPFVDDGSLPQTRISVDVADGGEDESIVTVGQHYQSVRRIREQRGYSFPSAESPIRCADMAEDAWQRYGCELSRDIIIVDSLGVGAGTAGELMRRGYPVVRYVGGATSGNPARWRNRRVQSYMLLRDELRDGKLFIDDAAMGYDDHDDFMAQLCSVQTRPEQERLEDLVTREQMKSDGIKSPDRADSLAMQYATQAPQMETGRGASGTNEETVSVHTVDLTEGLAV